MKWLFSSVHVWVNGTAGIVAVLKCFPLLMCVFSGIGAVSLCFSLVICESMGPLVSWRS